jgi:peptide/nickel transport system substrate-binding protein
MLRCALLLAVAASLALPVRLAAGSPAPSTFVFARPEETETLDPERTTAVSSAEVDYLLYDTLTSLDYDNRVKPGLAEQWQISPDGKTYTFRLRPGVRFPSGRALTAADVKFTLDRWRTLKGSPTAYNIAALDAVEAPNPTTVVLHLKEPLSVLLVNLSGYSASLLNQEFVTRAGDDYGTGPGKVDGTGPFTLKDWVRNDHLSVARASGYTWGPPIYANRGPARFGSVVFRTIVEDAPRIASVDLGEAQFAESIPAVQVDRLTKDSRVKVIRYSDLNTTFVGFKTGRRQLADVKVRQAINYAINKRQMIAGVFYGLADEAYGPLAPGTPGWWPGVVRAGYHYNPSTAKRMLEEAGWKAAREGGIRQKDGQRLTVNFLYSPGPQNEAIVNLMQADLAGVGVEMRPQRLEWTAFLAALRAGQHDMFLIAVRYVNADQVLYFYFHSKQRPAPNRFDWADAETDRLLDVSRASTSEAERMDAYRKLQQIVVANAIWVPLVHEKRVVIASPKLTVPRMHANVLYKMLDLELKP